MMEKLIRIFLWMILLFELGCGPEKLAPMEYTNWVRDFENGWHVSKQIGNVVIDLQNEPAEYTILKESKGLILSDEVLKGKLADLGGMDFYVLKLTNQEIDLINNKSLEQSEINERLYYFSFSMQNDIYLLIEDKELPVRIFNFERSYDLTKTKTFTIGFHLKPEQRSMDKTIVLDIKYTGIGKVKIPFPIEKLSKVPKLSL